MWAVLRFLWYHPKTSISLTLLLGFVLLNVLAYRHAYTMTHFAPGGTRTAGPEELSFGGKLKALLWGVDIPRPVLDATPDQVGLAYETLSLDGSRGRLEAWYVPHAGAKGIVLLFHGYTACKAKLLAEARGFHDLGYACLLVDFPGHGGSEGSGTTIGYHEADDVVRVAEYARERWPDRRMILFGGSMGAAAVMRALAIHRVTVDAAVLEAPFDRLTTQVKGRFQAMGLPSWPGTQLLLFWGSRQNDFDAFAHNPVEYAKDVKCPVLLLHGDADVRVKSEQIEAIYGNLAGLKRLHVFAGVGHESSAGLRLEEWKKQVGRFLAETAFAALPVKRSA